MRLNLLFCFALACGDDPTDVTPDAATEASPDVTPDATPESVAETTPEPETIAETTPEPETIAETIAETTDAEVVTAPADFSCLADPPSLPLPAVATVTWRARLVDTAGAPRKRVDVRVCRDAACATPDGDAVTDADGVVAFTLPAGIRGYSGVVEVTGAGLQSTLLVLDPPVTEDVARPIDVEILSDLELAAAASAAGVELVPNLAHARVRMLDCAGKAAPGVGVFFGGAFIGGTTKTWYADPEPGVAATTEGGLAGGFNLSAGETVVQGRVRALDNQTFGEAHLALRNGWLSLGAVHPAQVTADFSCHGVFPPPTVLPQTMGLSIRSPADGSPFVGATAKLCTDDACTSPLSTHTSDDDGVVFFAIPPGGVGSLDLSGAGLFPTRVDLRPPLTTQRIEGLIDGVAAMSLSAAQSFAVLAGTTLDPTRAHLLVFTHDCQSRPRPHLTIAVSSADASSSVHYLSGPLPEPENVATTQDGVVVVLNVPPGPATLTGLDDGAPFGTLTLSLHAGVLHHIILSPTALD